MKSGQKIAVVCITLIFVLGIAAAAWWLMMRGGSGKNGDNPQISTIETVGQTGESDEINGQGTQPQESESGETVPQETTAQEDMSDITGEIGKMSLEDKVSQLFILRPEDLTGVEVATEAGDMTKEALENYPISGIVYFGQNIESQEQLEEMIANTKSYSRYPMFIGVDEEGGTLVARIANSGVFDVPTFPDMIEIGAAGDAGKAYEVGSAIGNYLKPIGFNLDFAPIADVLTNPDNPVIGNRSFGPDAQVDAQMVSNAVKGFQDAGLSAVVKHFPGHGDTDSDSHEGQTVSNRTLEQLRSEEFLPFKAGIDAGVDFVMVGHISLPEVTGDMTPASVSKQMITDILRTELGYDGIVITDSFQMEAITQFYTPGEAAVSAIEAGVDIILMPDDFQSARQGIIDAVNDGTLSEDRIDESLLRIWKIKKNV